MHRIPCQTKQADSRQPAGANLYLARIYCGRLYSRFLPDFLAAAQRFLIPSARRLRAAADIVRPLRGPFVVGLLVLPGGRPRRFAGADAPPLTPSKACIAASSLLRSCVSSLRISERFMDLY